MVAVPASQHNADAKAAGACKDCSAELASPGHVCASCGIPQPVPFGGDYFSALGVDRRFKQDGSRLEKAFYDASRALHPDRFSTAGAVGKMRSLERMSWINQAYQTLKQPESLRQYLLEAEGVPAPKAQIPAELAEDWFEIRDLLIEEPEVGIALIGKFEEKLAGVKAERDSQLRLLESEADSHADAHAGAGAGAGAGAATSGERRGLLERIAQLAQEKNYIASMERDIERIKKQFS